MSNAPRVLFVARYKWPFQLAALSFAALLVGLKPSVSATWREDGWFFGFGVIIVYAVAFFGLLDVFVRRTWLTDKGMFQRSMFGSTKFAPYGQIQELLIKREEALIVKYQGDRSLKVHAKEGDPEAVIEVMRQFLDPETRVVTV